MLGAFLTPDYVSHLAAAAAKEKRWIEFDAALVRRAYNRQPFVVKHWLAEHPMFTFDALFALCRRMPQNHVKLRVGVVPADADFDTSLDRFNHGLQLNEAIANFVERQAYIVINNPELDAEYRPIIEGLLGEIARQTEAVDPGMNWYSTYLFISAQGSVTPYHMDREMNFLLQVCGTKTVRLWDPADNEIMSPAQKDQLLSAVDEPRPTYLPSFEQKAMIFELEPGLGVHHPFIAPHLVTTGPSPSISLAITFRTAGSDVWTDAHRFNRRLRNIGLNPAAVGTHPAVDRAKAALLRALRKVRRVLRTVAPV
jgi:Cupin-like domain